uniref:Cytochrome cd1 nitrite reductase n=1 Tax=Echinostoma caproni TaxID=27848 RepID=A0A183BH39_9TREM
LQILIALDHKMVRKRQITSRIRPDPCTKEVRWVPHRQMQPLDRLQPTLMDVRPLGHLVGHPAGDHGGINQTSANTN